MSVAVITYNHEPYIAQALESVLSQATDFAYEVVVGEDASCDRTREIVLELQTRHPDRLRLLPAERNLGMMLNFLRTLRACTGQYVALLDGDDYWTSPHKLQKQVEFLDRHPGCTICFHNVEVRYEGGRQAPHPFHLEQPVHRLSRPQPRPISSLADLVRGNFLLTCSVMYRSGFVDDPPEWLQESPLGDWPLHVLNAQHGDIGYLDEILAVYRVHAGGVWSANLSRLDRPEPLERLIGLYRAIDRHLGFQYQAEIAEQRRHLHDLAMQAYSATGRPAEATRHAARYLALLPLRARLRQFRVAKVLLRAHLPGVFRRLQRLRPSAAERAE